MKIKWNEAKEGNAHVQDGCMGFWAQFPEGTTAEQVLETYMLTADYSEATGKFTVTAEINGDIAEATIGPGGVPCY